MPDWSHPRAGIAANGLYRIGQIALITTTFGHQMSHLPHNSCQMRPGYWNFAELKYAPNKGKNIKTKGFCTSFEALESWFLMYFVPFLRFFSLEKRKSWCCISLIYSFLDEFNMLSIPVFQLFQLFFWVQFFSLYIYNYLYINYLYNIRKGISTSFF